MVAVLHRHRPQAGRRTSTRRRGSRSPTATDLSYDEKLAAYDAIADQHFDTERYRDFCASRLGDLDEMAVDYFESADFDRVLVETVTSTFPAHEHDQFVAHYRGLLASWCRDERARLA